MRYGFEAFKCEFSDHLLVIVTHLAVIIKSLERPNHVIHMMSFLYSA
jgi:hypothetical protein